MFFLSLRHAALAVILICAALFSSAAMSLELTAFDQKAAVVFVYFSIGEDSNPNVSLRAEQFEDQINELSGGGYNVRPLSEIIDAFAAGKVLPPRTVAITFDGAEKSIIEKAAPLLIERDLPFTVFVPASRIGKAPYMDWDDLKSLKKTGLVSFGAHPADYGRMAGAKEEDIRRQINNSTSQIRDNLNVAPLLLAYPFGEYSAQFESVVKSMGFKAAFGQNSGVAYAESDLFSLPRFTQTERYGDLERFRMTANALPFPAKDVSPADPHLTSLSPSIGFTVPDDLVPDLKALSCFSSTNEKPLVEIVGKRRVEIRMEKPFSEDRPRINCTLPAGDADDDEPRWRWFGTLYTFKESLLEDKSDKAVEKIQRHAADSIDDISIE